MLRTAFILTIGSLAGLGAGLTQPAFAQCDGFWEEAAPTPATRIDHCCAVVGNVIYIIGDKHYWETNDEVLAYDPEIDQWSYRTPMPTGRGFAAAAAVEKIIYVFGGNDTIGNNWLRTNEAYNTLTDTWEERVLLPGNKRGLLTAVAVGEKIYVMGGTNSYILPTFDYNHAYDPDTDTWDTSLAPLPRPRSHHAAVALDGKIYLIGGQYRLQHGEEVWIPEVDVYDPSTDEWTQAAPLPTPRSELTAVVLNGKIYAIGGKVIDENGEYGDIVSLVEMYDSVLDCWRTVTSIPGPRFSGTAAVARSSAYDGATIFMIGGEDGTEKFDTNFLGYPTVEPSGLFGDLDNDGDVDIHDLNLLRALLDPCLSADVNGDGVVDVLDLLTLLARWGACP